jgi:hypothetical protein
MSMEARAQAQVQPTKFEARRGSLASRILNPMIMKLRLLPFPARGGESPASRLIPVRPIEYDGARYVVANRGPGQWAQNLRAAGGGELLGKRGRKRFRAVEVKGIERERVVTAYRRQLGEAVRSYFERLPSAADHPTFRIEPCEQA